MKGLVVRNIAGVVLLGFIFCLSAVASDGDVYFDSNGNMVDKEQYEMVATAHTNTIKAELKNGYGKDSPQSKDPIALRKKRIEQWAKERSGYAPESLPSKIEIQPKKASQ